MNKNLSAICLILILPVVSLYAQNKTTASTTKVSSPAAKTGKPQPQVKSPKPVETYKPKRDTAKARQAAKIGNKVHREIQSTRGTGNKGRISEMRLTEVKTKKGIRPDIISKSGRPFEIKPNTVSGYRKGRQQLKRQENVVGKRGGLFLYDPKTGKYKIKRTPYSEWQKRRQEIRKTQSPKVDNRRLKPRF